MTNNATISLTNAHGLFAGVDIEVLNRAMEATKHRSLEMLRHQAAGCAGYPDYDWIAGEEGALDNDSRLEVLIIWIESGNYTF